MLIDCPETWSGLSIELLNNLIDNHTGNYRVIDIDAGHEVEMSLEDIAEFFGRDWADDVAFKVVNEMLTIHDDNNHILKSNGWIVKKLN